MISSDKAGVQFPDSEIILLLVVVELTTGKGMGTSSFVFVGYVET